MFGKHFVLNEETLSIVDEFGRHMPGGFFIYRAAAPEELLYANHAVLEIFGCEDMAEFRALTGYTFRGMLHPEDYAAVRLHRPAGGRRRGQYGLRGVPHRP